MRHLGEIVIVAAIGIVCERTSCTKPIEIEGRTDGLDVIAR